MKTKILTLLIAFALVFSSCESILDINPISEISNSNYWKGENDVKGYVTGMYNDYRSLTNTTLYGEDRGDALTTGAVGAVSEAWSNKMTAATNKFTWIQFYELIHHCNMVLKYAPDIEFRVENDKNRLLAQTYYFRAKAYMTLLQMWGDVPIVTEPTESYDQERPARKPASEVMEFILSDINTSIGLFPEATILNKNLISKPAAYCLKAEALAWKYKVLRSNNQQDLRDAISALDEAEKSGVSLVGDYAKIFAADNKKNSEIIFSLYLEKDEYAAMYMRQLSPNLIYVETADNKEDLPYSKGYAKHDYAPSNELIAALNVYPNDKRKPVAYINAMKGSSVILVSQNKFRGRIVDEDRLFDDDIIISRLGDVILLKAELYADLGGAEVSKAIAELERVRIRAGIGAYTGATDQLSVQKEILEERGRELCFELKRWPDLMRAHHANIIDIYNYVPNLTGQAKKTPLYLPIDQTLINVNPNLKQTAGY